MSLPLATTHTLQLTDQLLSNIFYPNNVDCYGCPSFIGFMPRLLSETPFIGLQSGQSEMGTLFGSRWRGETVHHEQVYKAVSKQTGKAQTAQTVAQGVPGISRLQISKEISKHSPQAAVFFCLL